MTITKQWLFITRMHFWPLDMLMTQWHDKKIFLTCTKSTFWNIAPFGCGLNVIEDLISEDKDFLRGKSLFQFRCFVVCDASLSTPGVLAALSPTQARRSSQSPAKWLRAFRFHRKNEGTRFRSINHKRRNRFLKYEQQTEQIKKK
jgi:hypothetical protein